ncbi:hypothetical protein ANTRET_LOCUS10840 [Anthophora retusa]
MVPRGLVDIAGSARATLRNTDNSRQQQISVTDLHKARISTSSRTKLQDIADSARSATWNMENIRKQQISFESSSKTPFTQIRGSLRCTLSNIC